MEHTFIPLHPAQTDVYTDQLINTDSPHYNIGGYIKLKGELDKTKFHETIQSIPLVFDAFKMRFSLNAEGPVCFLANDCEKVSLTEIDFSNEADAKSAAVSWMQQRFNIPFLLTEDKSLWENKLIKIAEDEYWFYGRYHHLLTDGYGFIVLIKYIADKYKSLAAEDGIDFSFPSYITEVIAGNEYLKSNAYNIDQQYWKNKISEAPVKLLPAKYALHKTGNSSSTYTLEIDTPTKKMLDELQSASKAGLQQLTLAALIIYFGKTTEQSEFIFGSTVHKRNSKKQRNMVGMFSGILPFKGTYQKDKTAAELVKEILLSQREDYRHQNYPIGDLTRDLNFKTGNGYLQETSVNYEPLFFAVDFGEKMDASIVRLANEEDRNPLQICWRDYGNNEALQLQIHFGNDYFSLPEIELFSNRLLFILQQINHSPDSRIDGINILPSQEADLLRSFNHTESTATADKSILDLFDKQVESSPEKIAVIFEDQQLSYRELNLKSNQLAHYLQKNGINNNSIVPVCLERSVEMIIAILGIMKAGAAYVPIDPEYPEDRISYMLQDINAAVIVSSKRSCYKIGNSLDAVIVEIDHENTFNGQPDDNLSAVLPGQLAYVIYTSGSTGKPKGVMIEHGSVVNVVTSVANTVGFSSGATFLSVTTYSFDICYLEFFMPLMFGGTLVIASGGEVINGLLLAKSIKKNNISHLQATPSTWQILLDSDWENETNVTMLIGGEAVRYEIKEALTRKGNLYNCYGPTETTIWSVVKKLEPGEKVLVGKPVSNTQVIILNRDGQQCPIGADGEICISGAGLARGYLNRPDLTSEKFTRGFFSNLPEAKLYHTGDLGRWLPDGNIECLGRLDDQVKIRGFRIELGEIETVLEQSGKMKQAVVIARDDKSGNKQLIGYVLTNGVFASDETIEYLKGKLPAYMIPSLWVEMEKFPLTPNGKVNRKALPDPDFSGLIAVSYKAPESETERMLVKIWQGIFGIDQIGVDDNFFELGGHSLAAIRITSLLRKELQIELPVKDLFIYFTVASLAIHIDRHNKTVLLPPVKKEIRPETIPLSFSQERLWFLDRLQGSQQYDIPLVLRLKGDLNVTALKHSLRGIVDRHEVLRTLFREKDGTPYQFIIEKHNWELAIGNYVEFQGDDLKTQINQLVKLAFDLSADYPIRGTLMSVAGQEYILVITLHHIAADAWSVWIIVKEVIELFNSFTEGRAANLEALPLQYADYAIWQRNNLHGYLLRNKIDYWQQKLEGVVPLELPTDYLRPAVRSSRGATIDFKITAGHLAQLTKFSQQKETSNFMVLLSIFKVLLYRYSGQRDICVGTSIASRHQQELEGLIGFFVNTLALRDEVDPAYSFTEFLKQVKTTTLEAYEHQDIPFEKVVEMVVKERDAARSPLFQVMFVWANTPEVSELKLGNLAISLEEYEQNTTKFDLSFFITETPQGLHGSVQYSLDLYRAETIGLMVSHFQQLLQSVLVNPMQKVGELQLLSEAETDRLLLDFNNVQVAYPHDKTIVALFEEQAAKTPDAIAVIFENQRLSFRELNERSGRLANHLNSYGVQAGALVPMYIERSPMLIVALLGIMKSGAAYVPIDTEFPPERIGFIVEDTASPVIVSSIAGSHKLPALGTVKIITIDSGFLNDESLLPSSIQVTSSDLAYVIYTSGSTGNPKGVMIEHRSLADYIFGLNATIQTDKCRSFALVSSIATDLGNTVVYASLLSGGSLHLFSKEAVSNAAGLQKYFIEKSIDCLKIVPSHWKALCMDDDLLMPDKLLIFGGEALQSAMVETIYSSGSRCRIVNHYGPTETTIGKLLHEVSRERNYNKTIPIGKPFSNTRVYILTKELQLCPIGIPGQLYIAGDGVARGYLNNEALTNEKLITNPFSNKSGSKMYATGDLVKWLPDGTIEFIGRVDDQVKIRGYRIELGEIESICQQCELVSQAIVLARDDKQGNKRLVGYIVPAGEFDKEGIWAYLKSRLPDYMIPTVLMSLDQLPLIANGKIDKKSLPDPEQEGAAGQYVAPGNETEVKLAEIWEEILEVERVGIHDDFFQLGGHSLLAVRLISVIRKELKIELSINTFFELPTIAQLSNYIKVTNLNCQEESDNYDLIQL